MWLDKNDVTKTRRKFKKIANLAESSRKIRHFFGNFLKLSTISNDFPKIEILGPVSIETFQYLQLTSQSLQRSFD